MSKALSQLLLDDDDLVLDHKHRALVDGLFAGLTKSQAAKRAGLSVDGSLRRILERPEVTEYARRLQEKEQAKWRITREQVTQGLMEAIQDAKMLEEPNTQINGWRELGRLHGLYEAEEKKVTLSVEKQERMRQIEDASDDELLDFIDAPVIEGDFTQVNG
jgi:phage terminase small subunit